MSTVMERLRITRSKGNGRERLPTREEVAAEAGSLRAFCEDDSARIGREISAAEVERDAAIHAADAKIAALKPDRAEVEAAERRVAELDYELRVTCDPDIREHGPVLTWLTCVWEHLCSHLGCGDDHRDDMLADMKRMGYAPGSDGALAIVRLEREQAIRRKAAELLKVVEKSRQRILALQVEAQPDIAAAVRAIVRDIPRTCPCTEALPTLAENS